MANWTSIEIGKLRKMIAASMGAKSVMTVAEMEELVRSSKAAGHDPFALFIPATFHKRPPRMEMAIPARPNVDQAKLRQVIEEAWRDANGFHDCQEDALVDEQVDTLLKATLPRFGWTMTWMEAEGEEA